MDTIFGTESSLEGIRQRNRFNQITKGLTEDEIEVYATVQRLVLTIDHMEQFEKRVELTTRMLRDKDYRGLDRMFPKGKKDKRAALEKRRTSKRLSNAQYDCNSPPSSSSTSSSGSSSPIFESSSPLVGIAVGGAVRNGPKVGKVK